MKHNPITLRIISKMNLKICRISLISRKARSNLTEEVNWKNLLRLRLQIWEMHVGNIIIFLLKFKLDNTGHLKLSLDKNTTRHLIFGLLPVWCMRCLLEICCSNPGKHRDGVKTMITWRKFKNLLGIFILILLLEALRKTSILVKMGPWKECLLFAIFLWKLSCKWKTDFNPDRQRPLPHF